MKVAQPYRYGLWLLSCPLITTASHTQQYHSTSGSAEIKKLEDEIATLKTSISELDTCIKTQVTDLQAQKADLMTQAEALKNRENLIMDNMAPIESSEPKVM
jgi:predicted  nucleic acid-binding Zn-ribbon protein